MSAEAADDLPFALQGSWHRFLEVYEPLRSDLYRYCRYLTRSPWDAEDLAQDTLARAFVTLGQMGAQPEHPKAWLFRVASNLWIDRTRRERPLGSPAAEPGALLVPSPQEAREAAGTLLVRLSPQERAAVVLKDVFDLTLDEIAEALATTPGAVKAALHRGREKLTATSAEAAETSGAVPPLALSRSQAPAPALSYAPAPGVLDAFCDAFNARDLDRLTALLLDHAIVEVVGPTTQIGRPAARATVLTGMLFGSKRLAAAATEGGIEPRFVQGALATSPRCELRFHRGEWLMLLWYDHAPDGEAVRGINRCQLADDGSIARLANYFFNPDCLAEICGELGAPFRSNGHRYSLPARCSGNPSPG